MPAPSAEADVSPAPKLSVIFLSSTSRVAVFNVVVVPLTVRLPPTITFPVVVTEVGVIAPSPRVKLAAPDVLDALPVMPLFAVIDTDVMSAAPTV